MANEFAALAGRFRTAAESSDPESSVAFAEAAAGQAIERRITADTCIRSADGSWFSLSIAPVLAENIGDDAIGIGAEKWAEIRRAAAHELQLSDAGSIPPLSEIQTPPWFNEPTPLGDASNSLAKSASSWNT